MALCNCTSCKITERALEDSNRRILEMKEKKVKKVMDEWKAGELHSGSKKGPIVKNQKQAVAIALSEARKSPKKK